MPFEKKNELNNMSPGYAKRIRSEYLSEFSQVKAFLAEPDNEEILERYLEAADEFNEQLAVHRPDDELMERALSRILHLLWTRDGDLARRKRLTRLVLYYMYYICDIGEGSSSAATN